jgi:exoribonuclease-2
LQSGDLVGIQTRSGPRLALVVELHGSKAAVVVGFEAKPERLPLRELELICPLPSGLAPAANLGALPWQLSLESLAAATPSRRDLAAAWVLLEGEGDPLALESLVDLLAPATTPQALAASWLLLQHQDLFRWRQGQLQRRGVNDLRQLRRDRRKAELRESRRQHWLELLAARKPLSADQLEAAQSQADQRADLKALQALAQGKNWGRRGQNCARCSRRPAVGPAVGRALGPAVVRSDACSVIWASGTPTTCRAWPAQPGLQGSVTTCSPKPADLAARADQAWPGDETRVDLTGLKTVTIDDADTREIDDALSLERWSSREGIGPAPQGPVAAPASAQASGPGPCSSPTAVPNPTAASSPTDSSGWRIWIHVADPGRLVPAGSPLDQEALRRASSLYLAGGSVPMFPPALSEGPFSLRQGQPCAAWSLAVQLDDDGAVVSHQLLRSWIKPLYRLTYDDADELIELAPSRRRVGRPRWLAAGGGANGAWSMVPCNWIKAKVGFASRMESRNWRWWNPRPRACWWPRR